ncbi:MAG TPA: VWA domain-containing protein [Candidatus Sulfotelmatobacter sp.]|nr:VWA domain-containing protein [Candidatus Sulfotelmatobacter sp.]
MPNALASTKMPEDLGLHVLKTDVKLVLVPVSVTDPWQRLVSGLGAENFQIFDGKKQQEIRHFSSEDLPVSIGIILDASGSMRDKMDRVRDAVHQFCEAANLQDEFFMISFSDEPRLIADFTSSSQDVEKELLFIQPKGRTALLDAIYLGLREMKNAKYGKRALLIISDGGDNHSRYSERDVRAAAKESDVMIYAIGTFDRYVPTEEELRGPLLLSEIADSTGGQAFTLQNEVELPAVARHIGKALRTQYVLGYSPAELHHDGKWHKIQVKLRLPRKFSMLSAHARRGYYAPAE